MILKYIKLIEKLEKWHESPFTGNICDRTKRYNDIIKEIRESCDEAEVFEFEKTNVGETVAKKRINNLFHTELQEI